MKDIHITDLKTFSTGCRRKWNWSSSLRMGLQHAMIPRPLFTGQLVHVGLDHYYKNDGDMDIGIQHMQKLAKHRAGAIQEHVGPMWAEERESVNACHEMSYKLLKHYSLWAPKRDEQFEILATEQFFDVPIPISPCARAGGYTQALRRGCYMDKTSQLVSGRIQLSGRMDGLIQDKETGDIYVLEFKTARTLKNVSWTFRDLQGPAYMYAASWLYERDIKGIVYRMLRKREPDGLLPLKTGGFSQKQKQKTSFEFVLHILRDMSNGDEDTFKDLCRQNKKLIRELHGRRTPQGNDFFMEAILHKPRSVLDSAMVTVYHEGLQMVDPNTPIYANPSWLNCMNCSFRGPCDLMEMGLEAQALDLLDAEYAPRTYWEDVGDKDD